MIHTFFNSWLSKRCKESAKLRTERHDSSLRMRRRGFILKQIGQWETCLLYSPYVEENWRQMWTDKDEEHMLFKTRVEKTFELILIPLRRMERIKLARRILLAWREWQVIKIWQKTPLTNLPPPCQSITSWRIFMKTVARKTLLWLNQLSIKQGYTTVISRLPVGFWLWKM